MQVLSRIIAMPGSRSKCGIPLDVHRSQYLMKNAHRLMGISITVGELEQLFNRWAKTNITDDNVKKTHTACNST